MNEFSYVCDFGQKNELLFPDGCMQMKRMKKVMWSTETPDD